MTDEERQAHIERLRSKKIVELDQVKLLHNWFDKKRSARKACRVVGASRTGIAVLNLARYKQGA